MSLFGPLLSSLKVERAVYTRLRAQLPTYLSEAEAQDGLARGTLAAPRSYATASQFGRHEDMLPCVGIHIPGATRQVKVADGTYRVEWALEVGVLCAASTEVNTDRLCKIYGAAVWGSIMQRQGLDGAAESIDWPDGGLRYDELPSKQDASRTLAFVLLRFDVLATEVLGTYGGPVLFDAVETHDYGDWPRTSVVHVDVAPLP